MLKTYLSYGDRITDNVGYFIHYNYESADDIREDKRQKGIYLSLQPITVKPQIKEKKR